MQPKLLPSLGLLATLGGCDVTEVALAPSAIAENQCETSEDCDGLACYKRDTQASGACVARETSITDLVIQVTAPASLPSLGGLSFFKRFEGLKKGGGTLELALEQVAHVEGRIDASPEGCTPSYVKGRSIPVDVSFMPSEQVLGVPTPVYAASIDPFADTDVHQFTVEIPAGEYDIYIKPKPDADCQLPPHLFLRYPVAGSILDILPVPKALPVDVFWPDQYLEPGWKVAMLDEQTGRVISTEPWLGVPEYDEAKGAYRYSAVVSYFDVESPTEPGKSGTEPEEEQRPWILRLTPPAGVERPSILGESTSKLEQKTVPPPNVTVKGQTAILGKSQPVEATLKLTATSLAGFDAGTLAAYTRTVSVPAEGLFEVSLPPGTYNVEATPVGPSAICSEYEGVTDAAPCLSVAKATWEVGTDPPVQAGRLIEFSRLTFVRGTANLWKKGVPMGATVRVTGSPAGVQTGLVGRYLGDTQPAPRSAGGLVGDGGAFEFATDPGLFDLVVQTDPGTRFGWYVWSVGFPEFADLGMITVQAPVIYSGQVKIGGGGEPKTDLLIPNALIRAYADADGNPGGHLVAIAETWANDQGDFELLIPSKRGPAPTREPR